MSQKPQKPKREPSSDTELLMSWNVPLPDLSSVDFFEIKWKKKEEKRWTGLKGTEGNLPKIAISITEFEKNATYQFTVKWTTKDGEDSQFSEVSDDVLITVPRSPQQPGKVSSWQTKATSACLSWGKPKDAANISYYNIKYRSFGKHEWTSVNTKEPTEYHDLTNLKSKHAYEFKVRSIFKDHSKGPYSEVSDTITTHEALATRIKLLATKQKSKNLQIYQIPLSFSDQSTNNTAKTRKGRFGKINPFVPTKTIMFVGASGAGKSTMIDGMINYILDVSWEDDFRFSLIHLTDDEKVKQDRQGISQTSWLTCYEVNQEYGSRLNYNLNVIDTPGFGDTQGRKADKKIVNQIREFFKAQGKQGIDTIDAVCIVVQSSLPRLDESQKYILDSVLSLFGKDIKDNIFFMMTFADGIYPVVLAALKEAGFTSPRYFSFNNVASDHITDLSNDVARISWKLGTDNFESFFVQLRGVKQRSLKLSLEVLETRQNLENLIDRLPSQIEAGVQHLDTIRAEADLLKKCFEDVEGNKNYTKNVTRNCMRTVSTTDWVTNCSICECTCDRHCRIPFNKLKRLCEAMSGGLCTVCPKGCSWKNHKSDDFYYENYFEEVEMTLADVKEKYDLAVSGIKEKTAKLESMKSTFKLKLEEVMSEIKKSRECVIKLNEGALQSETFNEINYIQCMVDNAKNEKKLGWKGRVQILEEIIKKAQSEQDRSHIIALKSWTDEDINHFL